VSARDLLIQAGLVLLAGGAVAGVRYVFLRNEKPKGRRKAKAS
jgi:hypothetical protein